MIRTLILGAVTAAAVALGGQAATAQEPHRGPFGPTGPGGYYPQPQPRHHHHYAVLVHHRGHWDEYGEFETRCEAERVADRLEDRGHCVRIEVIEAGRRR